MNNSLDKQYTDLLGDAYKNYLIEDAKILPNMSKEKMTELCYRLSQEEFINKIKTDDEFAKKWGVKVEIRELRRRERSIYYYLHILNEWYNGRNLPKRTISLTYNNQTIEIYE